MWVIGISVAETLRCIGSPAISIADTGLGIPKMERENVFNKFYRGNNTKKIKGTGLGLNIVKDLVEIQKGQIVVLENPDGGSIFSFTLPKKN